MSRAKSLAALVLLGAVLAFVFFPRTRHSETPAVTVTDAIQLFGYGDDGSLQWELRAATGSMDSSEQVLEDVSVRFFGQDQSALAIRGDRLVRSDGESRLSGDVRMERSEDVTLDVDTLTWDETSEQLASGAVAVESDDLSVSAGGFGYDLTTETASFVDGVEARVALETAWTVRSSRAEEHSGVMVFADGVEAESADGEHFECDSLAVEERTATLRGDVTGTWTSGSVNAAVIELSDTGIRASGGVVARLDLQALEKTDES